MNEIKTEHNKSKSQKRQKGLESLVPQSQKAQLRGYEPKDPTSPTKHRKNYCCSPGQDRIPLKKSANSKWSNNQQSARKEQERNPSRSGSRARDRSARSQSRKIKTIFYKDGDSHIDMQNSKFSPQFSHIGKHSAKPFTLDGENLIPAGKGDHFEVYDMGNDNMYKSFKENSPSKSAISKHLTSINLKSGFQTPIVRPR